MSSVCYHAFSPVIVPDEENVILTILSGGQHAVSESGIVIRGHKIGDHGVSLVRRDSEILNKKPERFKVPYSMKGLKE